jgi:hypothetical protein
LSKSVSVGVERRFVQVAEEGSDAGKVFDAITQKLKQKKKKK